MLVKEIQTIQIKRLIGQSWVAFGKLSFIFKNKRILLDLNIKIFN